MKKEIPPFAKLSCCTPEQAAKLVALGVRPISFFKYRNLENCPWADPFTDYGYRGGVSECFENRSLPAFTLVELNLMPRFSTYYFPSAAEMADAVINYLSKGNAPMVLRLWNEALVELLPKPE